MGRPLSWSERERQLGRISKTCDQAVALSGGNGAVRESRGLANVLLGAREQAIADFQVYRQWTAEPREVEQRERWIAALRGPAPWTLPSESEVETLLARSRERDFEGWTRDSAQAHLARGAELLTRGSEPVDEALASFERATILVRPWCPP